MHPDDQVFHRFLWRKNQHEPPIECQWLRLNFRDNSPPDIEANAINILAKASQVEFPEAAKAVEEQKYVDDIAGSKPSTKEVKHVTSTIDKVLAKGQFQVKLGTRPARMLTKLVVMSALQICLATVETNMEIPSA